jgi:hypothetical protein
MISFAFSADANRPFLEGLGVEALLEASPFKEFELALPLLLLLRGVAFGDGTGSLLSSSNSLPNLEDADLFEIASNSAIKAASSSMIAVFCLVRLTIAFSL